MNQTTIDALRKERKTLLAQAEAITVLLIQSGAEEKQYSFDKPDNWDEAKTIIQKVWLATKLHPGTAQQIMDTVNAAMLSCLKEDRYDIQQIASAISYHVNKSKLITRLRIDDQPDTYKTL
jgi:hypothetical protein